MGAEGHGRNCGEAVAEAVVCSAEWLLQAADDLTGIRLTCHTVKGLEECAHTQLQHHITALMPIDRGKFFISSICKAIQKAANQAFEFLINSNV